MTWLDDAAQRFRNWKDEQNTAAAEWAARRAEVRPVLLSIPAKLEALVRRYNEAVGENRVIAERQGEDVLAIHAQSLSSGQRAGVRVTVIDASGSISTRPSDNSYAFGNTSEQGPFLSEYSVSRI